MNGELGYAYKALVRKTEGRYNLEGIRLMWILKKSNGTLWIRASSPNSRMIR
jgi:hypothetical protein